MQNLCNSLEWENSRDPNCFMSKINLPRASADFAKEHLEGGLGGCTFIRSVGHLMVPASNKFHSSSSLGISLT